jgi:hypothetical protein
MQTLKSSRGMATSWSEMSMRLLKQSRCGRQFSPAAGGAVLSSRRPHFHKQAGFHYWKSVQADIGIYAPRLPIHRPESADRPR